MDCGWAKMPKNKTDIKLKITKRLLALRKRNEIGEYVLDQDHVLVLLSQVCVIPALTPIGAVPTYGPDSVL